MSRLASKPGACFLRCCQLEVTSTKGSFRGTAGRQFEEKEEGCGNYSHRLGMGSALASVTDCTPPLRRAQRGATPISGDDAVRFLELECPVRFLYNRSEGSCRQNTGTKR